MTETGLTRDSRPDPRKCRYHLAASSTPPQYVRHVCSVLCPPIAALPERKPPACTQRALWLQRARAGGVIVRSGLLPLGRADSHYSRPRSQCSAGALAPECYPLLKRIQSAIRAHAMETCQCRRVPITAALYSAPHAPRFSERIIERSLGTRCTAGTTGVTCVVLARVWSRASGCGHVWHHVMWCGLHARR